MARPAQNFRNHSRYVPGYHFVLLGLVIVLLARATEQVVRHPGMATLFDLLLVLALLLVTWYARAFALTAQDRLIRLEMRLRMQAVTPQLASRFGELTPRQVTALRFASDAELPALAQQVLDGRLIRSNDIKAQIRDWQADELRV